MFTHSHVRRVRKGKRRIPPRSGSNWIALIAAASLLGGCTATSAPFVGPDPSDPNVRVPPAAYRSTIGSYTSQRPVSPSDWREQNQRVAPRSSQ